VLGEDHGSRGKIRDMRRSMCMVACVVLASCSGPDTTAPSLTYAVGGCAEEADATRASGKGEVHIVGEGHIIHVEQKLVYVCCAELELALDREGNTIVLVERNVGEICRCLCEYDVSADVIGLDPGTYDVQVWGVEYQDMSTPELLAQATVTLP
jgi:hypothetical protein